VVGVVLGGCCCGVSDGVVLGVGWLGMKEMDNVPEKRTTLTDRATGRMAVSGFG